MIGARRYDFDRVRLKPDDPGTLLAEIVNEPVAHTAAALETR